MSQPANTTMVRVRSHRARDKMFKILPEKPQGFWSWERNDIHAVPNEFVQQVLEIKGITKTKWTDDLMMCWNFDNF